MPAEKPRILCIDDDPDILQYVKMNLELEGFEAETASNGIEALEIAAKSPPALVLLDVMMPGMDGYEVCQKLKNMEITRNIPVIFLTALKEEGDEARGLGLGAVDYITKPFNPEVVKARVKNHLDLKRHQNHLEELVEIRTQEIAECQRVEY